MRVVVFTLCTHQSHWITCRENSNFWLFISKIPRPFWSGREARHFEKPNFLYDFSIPSFQFWAGIATSTQLLAGLALKPKTTSHPKTLDTGGKLGLHFSKALCRSQGLCVPSYQSQVELFGTPGKKCAHPALSGRSDLATPTNMWCTRSMPCHSPRTRCCGWYRHTLYLYE